MAKPDQLDVRALTGADLAPALADVARLRIAVFRDWPYLYDGDLAYEKSICNPIGIRTVLSSLGLTKALIWSVPAQARRWPITRMISPLHLTARASLWMMCSIARKVSCCLRTAGLASGTGSLTSERPTPAGWGFPNAVFVAWFGQPITRNAPHAIARWMISGADGAMPRCKGWWRSSNGKT
jgi:hypothetical protein